MNAKLKWPLRSKAFIGGAAALLIAVVASAGFVWNSRKAFVEPASLLSRFPAEEAAVASADLSAIRNAGLLGASTMALEPEYKQFLDATGFDYRHDLDHVTAAFSKSGNYFIARGSFNWDKLRDYALRQGGSCYQELCRLQGSTPERHISFLPLRRDVLALAISTNDLAASRLTTVGQRVTASLPAAPVWVSLPGSALKQPGLLPPLMRVMLSSLMNADRIVVTIQPAAAGMEARLETTCRNVDEARVLSSQLQNAAATLKRSSDDDLARALAAGAFSQTDRVVTGRWPLSKTAVNNLVAGL